jgi:hypothetical protein
MTEPTSYDGLQRVIELEGADEVIGRVLDIRTRQTPETISNHEVDVALFPPDSNIPPENQTKVTDVPIKQPTSGAAALPTVGSLVRLSFRNADQTAPLVDGVVYGDADTDRAPIAEPGEMRFTREGASIEVVTNDADEPLARVVKCGPEEREATGGIEYNLSSGRILIRNENGHGIEIPSDGNIKLYGNTVDIDTTGSAPSFDNSG